ncbi:MAG: hypothetical protein ACLTZI_08645 [[Eubacterium] siraeum]
MKETMCCILTRQRVTEKLSDVNEDYDVAAVRTFEIPDGSHGFYFSVTVGNSSPLYDNNGGRIDVEFYDANGVKTVGDYSTFYIYNAENFIEAYLGDDKPAPIPEDAKSMVYKSVRGFRYKNDRILYEGF